MVLSFIWHPTWACFPARLEAGSHKWYLWKRPGAPAFGNKVNSTSFSPASNKHYSRDCLLQSEHISKYNIILCTLSGHRKANFKHCKTLYIHYWTPIWTENQSFNNHTFGSGFISSRRWLIYLNIIKYMELKREVRGQPAPRRALIKLLLDTAAVWPNRVLH